MHYEIVFNGVYGKHRTTITARSIVLDAATDNVLVAGEDPQVVIPEFLKTTPAVKGRWTLWYIKGTNTIVAHGEY